MRRSPLYITLTYVSERTCICARRRGGAILKTTPMEAHVSSRDRDTIEKIFAHPASGNVEWRQVVSLLEAIAAVTHEDDDKLRVSLGPETEVLRRPHGKDVDVQPVVDLRRMLKQAGFAPDLSAAADDQSTRDHGDGQWGAPN